MPTMKPLILASQSPYRKQLLETLQQPFRCWPAHIDETPKPDESPEALVQRLAWEKSAAVAAQVNEAWVIGSDQVAVIDGRILGKPGDHATARTQLTACSGQWVVFYTGLCLLDADTLAEQRCLEPYRVKFRTLSAATIETYLQKEKPYDCAGSFRSEGLGISLFETMEGRDPNALVGLPLMGLVDMLLKWGGSVL